VLQKALTDYRLEAYLLRKVYRGELHSLEGEPTYFHTSDFENYSSIEATPCNQSPSVGWTYGQVLERHL
jgi:hypothetical protein